MSLEYDQKKDNFDTHYPLAFLLILEVNLK